MSAGDGNLQSDYLFKKKSSNPMDFMVHYSQFTDRGFSEKGRKGNDGIP
jgi:hypothetical protein